jgi:aminopeptidase N
MSSHALTDKSGQLEAAFSGFLLDAPHFAEPGIEPHYAPDSGFVLKHTDLHLTIDPVGKTMSGEAVLHIAPLPSGLGEVIFDLDDLYVASVENADTGSALSYRHDSGKIRILGVPAEGGKIRICWSGAPTRGLYFTGPNAAVPDRPHMAWSQCQDEDAHFFFPCLDRPGVKAPMDIRITVPEGFQAISNGAVAGVQGQTYRFVQADPIPVYLFTVIVGDLMIIDDGDETLPIRYLAPAGTDEAVMRRVFGKTPAMIAFFSKVFGYDYAWPRYDQIVVHDFIFGGMENVAATTLTDLVLTDERAAIDWDAEDLIAHELAHQWFGDLVTCQDWSQGWLNEGWATYSEVVWKAHDLNQDEADYHLFLDLTNYLAESGGRYQRPIVSYHFREPIDMFDRHLYEKGALVNHTLRTELGETAFWGGTQHYLQRHAHGTVHSRDLQRAMEEVSGRNLDGFFQQWVEAPGHPVLEVSTSWSSGQLKVSVSQKQKGDKVPKAYRFPLTIKMITSTGSSEITLAVAERSRAWTIPCPEEPTRVEIDSGFRFLADLRIKSSRALLLASLRDDSCVVGRIRAARALAKEGSPKAIASLITALSQEPFWGVRIAIAKLLSTIGTADCRTALIDCIGESHPKARKGIVTALGGLGPHADITAALMTLAKKGDESLQVEAEAARSLGRLRAEGAVDICAEVAARPSWGAMMSARAIEGMSHTRDPAALPHLLSWSEADKPERARAAAAAGLGRLADQVESCRAEAIDRLVQLAKDGPFRVRYAAIPALGTARATQAIGMLRRVHEGQGDGRLRRQAFEAIRRIRRGRSGESAVAGLRQDLDTMREENRSLRSRLDKLEVTKAADSE